MEDCCPICKMTLKEIKETHKIGCENCFYLFKEPILEFLLEKFPIVAYKGQNKINSNMIVNISEEQSIEQLKELLQKAVEVEDYETAIYFRNEIKKLENL